MHDDAARKALATRCLVRAIHGEEQFDGRVICLTDELLVLKLLDHGIRYDGVVALRTESVETLMNPHPQSEFYELVLAARDQDDDVSNTRPDCDSMRNLLDWCQGHLDIVTLHLTHAEPGVCHIGRILRLTDDAVVLREIGIDASWSSSEIELFVDEIERVDFGGAYEEALLIGARLQGADG